MANNIRLRDSNGIVRNLDISGGGTGASNVTDARTNLGLNGIFIIQKFSKSYTLAGNSATSFDTSFITIPTGFSIAAIASWSANADRVLVASMRPVQNNQWSFELRNVGSSAANTSFDVWILFVKSEFMS